MGGTRNVFENVFITGRPRSLHKGELPPTPTKPKWLCT